MIIMMNNNDDSGNITKVMKTTIWMIVAKCGYLPSNYNDENDDDDDFVVATA